MRGGSKEVRDVLSHVSTSERDQFCEAFGWNPFHKGEHEQGGTHNEKSPKIRAKWKRDLAVSLSKLRPIFSFFTLLGKRVGNSPSWATCSANPSNALLVLTKLISY
jgi:hypothetical protein